MLRVTGGLDYGPARDAEDMHRLLTAAGVPAELLPPSSAAERWPGFAFSTPDGPVLYHAEAGVIDADHAMTAMRRVATANGAMFHYETPVTTPPAANSSSPAKVSTLAHRPGPLG